MSTLFKVPGIISGRFFGLLLDVLIFILTIFYLGRKKALYIRRVPSIDAIEEAIGRSTEMGKPVYFSYGLAWSGFDLNVLTGISLLAYIARMCARSDTRVIVPTGGSEGSYIVRPTAEETVKTAYTLEGKPEMFNPDDIPFLSGQQYAYIGKYVGMMQREPPGAVIATFGSSEHLNIAETANALGAITINAPGYAGNISVLACASDFLMWPEEAPAAAAYLSREPMELASIRVQDILKWAAIAIILVGLIAVTGGSNIINRLISS